jgi:hypothetical protein
LHLRKIIPASASLPELFSVAHISLLAFLLFRSYCQLSLFIVFYYVSHSLDYKSCADRLNPQVYNNARNMVDSQAVFVK